MPTTHAILAPSASKRWMTCTPSARLEAQVPSKETAYTREGTIAHSMAEALLLTALDANWPVWDDEFLAKFQLSYAVAEDKKARIAGHGEDLRKAVNEAIAEGLDPWEMLDTVFNYYCRFVYEEYLEARNADPEAVLLVEQKLRLTEYIPEGFGSSDAVIIYGTTLMVFDLKYGKGVKVSAEGNTQMLCYALGAVLGPGEMYDIETIHTNIIQPRLRWVSTDVISYRNLMGWAKEELRPKALQAFTGTGEFVPGDHCRFCSIAPRCKAFAAMATRLSHEAIEHSDTTLMTNAEIADMLHAMTGLKSWMSGLEAYALEKAMAGETFPGFKVVEGRSVRQISDPAAAMKVLQDAGFEESSYCKPKELKTISDLEKLLKKKGFQEMLGGYVIKPQGKPALVEESDPRPAISSVNGAMEDFKEYAQ